MTSQIRKFKIKRKRIQYNNEEKWVAIGSVTINLTDGTGTIYLNHQDEIWKLFENERKITKEQK